MARTPQVSPGATGLQEWGCPMPHAVGKTTGVARAWRSHQGHRCSNGSVASGG